MISLLFLGCHRFFSDLVRGGLRNATGESGLARLVSWTTLAGASSLHPPPPAAIPHSPRLLIASVGPPPHLDVCFFGG